MLALALLAALAAPTAAIASPWRGIGVTLHDLGFDKTPTLIVFGSLAEDVEIPTTVELPIPAGSEVGWVGEVFGQDPSLDTIAEFTVRAEDGYDVVVIEVTSARAVQAELVPPEAWIDRGDASIRLAMVWIAHENTPGVRLGFEIPDTAHAEQIVPERALREQTMAGILYSVETTSVSAGDVLTFDALVLPGADPLLPEPGSSEEATDTQPETVPPDAEDAAPAAVPVVPILAGIVAALLALLALALVRSRQNA
jgi:hypothetical protein